MTDLIDRNIIAGLVDAHGNVHWEDIKDIPCGVVHCKDCKHNETCIDVTIYNAKDNDFCSKGVKKDDMD